MSERRFGPRLPTWTSGVMIAAVLVWCTWELMRGGASVLLTVIMLLWLPWPAIGASLHARRGGHPKTGALVGLFGPLAIWMVYYGPRPLYPDRDAPPSPTSPRRRRRRP